MKRNFIILYILLIALGIYAIAGGVVRDKKNEEKLVILEKQGRQKTKIEESKSLSLSLYQSLDKVKIVWNKSKQEEAIKIATESKDMAKTNILNNFSIAKVETVKANQEVVRVEKVKVNKPTLINATNQAKIEATRLAKIEAENIAKEKAAALVKEATAKEVAIQAIEQADKLAKEEADKIAKEETDKIANETEDNQGTN